MFMALISNGYMQIVITADVGEVVFPIIALSGGFLPPRPAFGLAFGH